MPLSDGLPVCLSRKKSCPLRGDPSSSEEPRPSPSINFSPRLKKFSCVLLICIGNLGAYGAKSKSNSKGSDSPLVIGPIISVSGTNTVTILYGGEFERKLNLSKDTEIVFVGMPATSRSLKVGYGAKASIKNGTVRSLKLTLPVKDSASLGPDCTKLSIAQVLAKADGNADGGLDYVEMSRWIYHSPKHGPDTFLKTDKNKDGLVGPKELPKLLAGVSWWKYSRKSSGEWFRAADANGDGVLDLKEFTSIAAGKNHAENVFKRTDKNKDGSLDGKEVEKYVDQLIGSAH